MDLGLGSFIKESYPTSNKQMIPVSCKLFSKKKKNTKIKRNSIILIPILEKDRSGNEHICKISKEYLSKI